MTPGGSPTIRRVHVRAERLEGFLARFGASHGELSWTAESSLVTVQAGDGTVASCPVPFPPLDVDLTAPYGGLLRHVLADRTVGVVLARRGGHAVGLFRGTRLVSSKVGSRYVQGRSAAGGWSQQRFARRREGQSRAAFAAAADAAASVLLPVVETLDAVVLGGDRTACAAVMADARLALLARLLVPDRLDVPEPRHRVLLTAPDAFRGVRVRISDPPTEAAG